MPRVSRITTSTFAREQRIEQRDVLDPRLDGVVERARQAVEQRGEAIDVGEPRRQLQEQRAELVLERRDAGDSVRRPRRRSSRATCRA
jgi:hypothetical protein